MQNVFKFTIECGEKTCASEPGKFCQFLGSLGMRARPICRLFPSEVTAFTKLEDTVGKGKAWVLRCLACLEQEEIVEQAIMPVCIGTVCPFCGATIDMGGQNKEAEKRFTNRK